MSESAVKGFFHRSDARLVTPEERQARDRVVSSVFYGYSPEVLSTWCCVSLETAKRWKSFESLPSPRALRLFELHRARKLLASAEWAGWLVKGDVLVDPEGNETTQAQLRAYRFVYQLACAVGARLDGSARTAGRAATYGGARCRLTVCPARVA